MLLFSNFTLQLYKQMYLYGQTMFYTIIKEEVHPEKQKKKKKRAVNTGNECNRKSLFMWFYGAFLFFFLPGNHF